MHVAVLIHLAHWRIAGRTLTPLEPSEAMQTLELGWVNAGFVLLVLALLATLLLGRFFCGWACHVVAYQDLCAWLLGKVGLRPRPFRARLLGLVPLAAALYMFVWPSVARIARGEPRPALVAHFTTEELWATFPGPATAVLTLVVDGFLLVWLLGSKGFCTYGCPYGGLFGLADRFAPGRIRVSDACDGCGQCTAVCTSNVRVHEEVARHRRVVDPGCMKCLDCVASCPTEALRFGLGPTLGALPSRARRARRAWDLGWGEELALAAVFLAATYAFRGLYRAVPLLLAVGLALLCSVAALTVWRTLRGREMRFQHWTLKAGGRLRAAGVVALGSATGLMLLAGHSGWVQYHAREGERLLRAAGPQGSPAREELLLRSRSHLLAARRAGLVAVGVLELQLGAVESALGRREEAEARYRAALRVDPSLRAPRLALADLLVLRGELEAAERELRALLELEPSHPQARRRLRRLEARGDPGALSR